MSTHTNPFPILLVPDAARGRAEPMGTKEKFWWEPESTRYLFKFARPGTGEHWSEKLASELAMVLGVPCASVELATFHDRPGCAVRTFLRSSASLVHGNELLQEKDDSYPVATLRGVSKHTVSAVLIAERRRAASRCR